MLASFFGVLASNEVLASDALYCVSAGHVDRLQDAFAQMLIEAPPSSGAAMFGAPRAGKCQTQRHVVADGLPRQQRVLLEQIGGVRVEA